MRIIETKPYQFQELDEQTKEKAIDNYRYVSVEHDSWWDFIKEDLTSVGIELRSFDIDRGSFAEIHLEDFYETCELILKWHGEKCGTHKIAERYIKEYKHIQYHIKDDEDLDEKLDDLDEEYEKEFSEEVLSMLRKEYEYMTSDKYIIEIFEANDFEFTNQGKLI
tara:strand:+ start:258 stop:752 length:495 start_codon:yes stop_codon:yes gene_type:complete